MPTINIDDIEVAIKDFPNGSVVFLKPIIPTPNDTIFRKAHVLNQILKDRDVRIIPIPYEFDLYVLGAKPMEKSL